MIVGATSQRWPRHASAVADPLLRAQSGARNTTLRAPTEPSDAETLPTVCTTPAAFLSILFTPDRKKKVWFAIFRAIANNLELLCFALNFFVYCLCSADIRRAFVDVLFENCVVLYLRSKAYKPNNVELATVGRNYPQNV